MTPHDLVSLRANALVTQARLAAGTFDMLVITPELALELLERIETLEAARDDRNDT